MSSKIKSMVGYREHLENTIDALRKKLSETSDKMSSIVINNRISDLEYKYEKLIGKLPITDVKLPTVGEDFELEDGSMGKIEAVCVKVRLYKKDGELGGQTRYEEVEI